jgi:hypothetical protein
VPRFRDFAARSRDRVARLGDRLYVTFAAGRRSLARLGGSAYLDPAAAGRLFWQGLAGLGVLLLILTVSGLVIGGIVVLLQALLT